MDAKAVAAAWRSRLAPTGVAAPPRERVPEGGAELVLALVEFVAATFTAGQTLLMVLPDDELLPQLSNALELALRPLCLVLPQPGFAARTAQRATLSLLRSRLARGGESSFAAIWQAQQVRLAEHSKLWASALEWCAGNDVRSLQIGDLFPVCILSLAQTDTQSGAQRDVLVILYPERMPQALPGILSRGRLTLLLCGESEPAAEGRTLSLVDEEARLFTEREFLAQQLSEMELEFATAQAELAEFTRRYFEQVGARIAELDQIQAGIAVSLAKRTPDDAPGMDKAREAQAQAERSRRERRRFVDLGKAEKPFTPSRDIKRLFRQVAQKIHPDRAEGEADRAWRTDLMSEANRAYRNSDEMVLREILAQWQDRLDDGTNPAPRTPNDLTRQAKQMQRRIGEIAAELNRLFGSPLYELFLAAKLAQANGRDLLQEMADKLDSQIAAAQQQLRQFEAG